MKRAEEIDLDRAHVLMMAVLDGECTGAERHELDALIAGRPGSPRNGTGSAG